MKQDQYPPKLVFGDPVAIQLRDRLRGVSTPSGRPTTSGWRLRSRSVIANAFAENPDANRKQMRKILFEAYPFGVRQYTPYKLWCQEVKAALDVMREAA